MSEPIAELEALLRSLLKGSHSSLTIGFNDGHAPNYQTAQEAAAGGDEWLDRYEWVSDEERAKAIATNSVWTCQWYPNTPVGFEIIAASSLSALVEALKGRV